LITNNARDRRVESPRFISCLMYCPLSKHPFRLFYTFTCVITRLSVLPARLGTLLEHLTSSLFADYSVLSRVPFVNYAGVVYLVFIPRWQNPATAHSFQPVPRETWLCDNYTLVFNSHQLFSSYKVKLNQLSLICSC
jgi:hypothetical protein